MVRSERDDHAACIGGMIEALLCERHEEAGISKGGNGRVGHSSRVVGIPASSPVSGSTVLMAPPAW